MGEFGDGRELKMRGARKLQVRALAQTLPWRIKGGCCDDEVDCAFNE